jgi:2-polyprenyl-3-methyl-5-hydroxy-6-metoxy-1,4-benzoquinol methylase
MRQSIIEGYAEDASLLIQSFEAISSAALLSHVVRFIPKTPCNIIEIGAGTGRDAAWLASKGHTVTAVEPVFEFREAGKSLHTSSSISWLNDSLPLLNHVNKQNEQYELALLISVWQHVPDKEKLTSLTRLRSLLTKGGQLIISIRNGAGSTKRQCFPTTATETIMLAQQCGFELVMSKNVSSAQKQNIAAKVTWTWLVFSIS